MKTIGETLIELLEDRGTEVIFGIPGVHTIEMYRGLDDSSIRHVTPRHEQGAGFMADGYARTTGKVGVAFVITGPGLTNTLTAMAQARADSIPMLVISSVNKAATLGKGLGYLHELPDQHELSKTVALKSFHVTDSDQMIEALEQAFDIFNSARGGPIHIQIPLDILSQPFETAVQIDHNVHNPMVNIVDAVEMLKNAVSPIILAGGGAKFCGRNLQSLAEKLDAPVVQTVNARGLMHAHPLTIPASPSLPSVRDLIKDADVVLALGTEFGPTDYDMYQDGLFPKIKNLIRVDIDAKQLQRHPCKIAINADVKVILPQMIREIDDRKNNGSDRAAKVRSDAFANLNDDMREQIQILNTIRDKFPMSMIAGDSTQAIYAGNLYYDHDRPSGWFNAATGFGALGLAIPAAVGAAVATKDPSTICIAGDGGAQFSIAELMTATDNKLPILFIIWNNDGFGEIDSSMKAVGIDPVGCDPSAPKFEYVAAAASIPFQTCTKDLNSITSALAAIDLSNGPCMIEIKV